MCPLQPTLSEGMKSCKIFHCLYLGGVGEAQHVFDGHLYADQHLPRQHVVHQTHHLADGPRQRPPHVHEALVVVALPAPQNQHHLQVDTRSIELRVCDPGRRSAQYFLFLGLRAAIPQNEI